MQLRSTALLALLIAITICAYSASLYGPFVFDDAPFITKNPTVNFQQPISIHGQRAFTVTTFRVNYLFGQEDPFGYHIVNLAIHLANVALVFFLLRALIGDSFAVVIGTAIFALHPLQTEAVVYLSGRAELLATGFSILASLLYLSGYRKTAILPAMLAISSKESAAVLFLIIGFYEVRRRKWSLAQASAAFGVLMFAALPFLRLLRLESADRSWFAHLLLQSGQALRYAAMFFVPIGQTIDHDAETLPLWFCAMGLVGLAMAIWAAWEARYSVAGFGLAFALLAVLPRFALNIPEFMAEHHLYLPMVGISLASAAVVARFTQTEKTHDLYHYQRP